MRSPRCLSAVTAELERAGVPLWSCLDAGIRRCAGRSPAAGARSSCPLLQAIGARR